MWAQLIKVRTKPGKDLAEAGPARAYAPPARRGTADSTHFTFEIVGR